MNDTWQPSSSEEEEQPFIGKSVDGETDSATYSEVATAAPPLTFVERITRRKIIHQSSFAKSGLRRVLSTYELIFLGVGFIIGAGIFTIIGTAAHEAGPGLIVSFLMVGVVSVFVALCYAEMASAYPLAGSAYSYTYLMWGELLAWFVGWNLILEYTVASALVARSWSSYLRGFFESINVTYPLWMVKIDVTGFSYLQPNITAGLIVLLLMLLVCSGLRASVTTNKIVVSIKVLILLFFIGAGSLRTHHANYDDFFPNGAKGVFLGASLVFFAFIGFDNVSSLAEDTKNPRRALPIGIFGSLAVVLVLYVGVAALLVGMKKYTELNSNEPLAAVFADLPWARAIISIAAICGILTTILSGIIGQSRIYYGMARDGLLPTAFTILSSEQHTPVKATLLSGVPAIFIAFFFNIDILGSLTSIGACFAFITVCASVLQRRLGPMVVVPKKLRASSSSAFEHTNVPDDSLPIILDNDNATQKSSSDSALSMSTKTPVSPSHASLSDSQLQNNTPQSFDLTVSPPSPSAEPVEASTSQAPSRPFNTLHAEFNPEDTPMGTDNAFWHFAYNDGSATIGKGSIRGPPPADLSATVAPGTTVGAASVKPSSSVLYGPSLSVPASSANTGRNSLGTTATAVPVSTTGATPFSYATDKPFGSAAPATSLRARTTATTPSASSSIASPSKLSSVPSSESEPSVSKSEASVSLLSPNSRASLFPSAVGAESDDSKRRLPLWALVMTLIVLTTLNSISIYRQWPIHLIIVLSICVIGVCIVICLIPSHDERLKADEFRCPCFPVIPLLGIITVTHVMIGQGEQVEHGVQEGMAFVVYGIWVFFGMVVYFLYGFRRMVSVPK